MSSVLLALDFGGTKHSQCFVLGGGVTQSGDRFWQVVQETARQTALPEVNFEIIPAALEDEAPLWGAIALAQSQLEPQSISSSD